jgi:redox-sensing transcriptional repressor
LREASLPESQRHRIESTRDMRKEGDPSERATTGHDARMSRACVGRLSLYLRRLEGLLHDDVHKVSSSQLGEAVGVTDAQVRKDLASLGHLGHPGVGYAAVELIAAIRHVLGIDREWRAALAGAGNLARALLRYQGFVSRGFRIVALFDADPAKIGQRIDGLEIHATAEMPSVIAGTQAELGMLTVPAEACQSVAEAMVAAGIRGLLNFAPTVLRLPPMVQVVSVDLTVQLEQLAFLVQGNGGEP